jgi:hypothetical protein
MNKILLVLGPVGLVLLLVLAWHKGKTSTGKPARRRTLLEVAELINPFSYRYR